MAEIEAKMKTLLSEADSGAMGWRERLDKAMTLVAQAWDEGYGAGLDHEANRARDREWPVATPNPYRVISPGPERD